MMKRYLFCAVALLMCSDVVQAKSSDATDTIESPKHVAPSFTADSANIPAKDTAAGELRLEDRAYDREARQPIGMGAKASSSGLSIDDYVMVPVENLEAQLNQNGKRAGHPTGKLKGKYPTFYAGTGASSADAGDATGDDSDGDGYEGDEDDEDDILGDDSDDDDGNGSIPQEINI